LIAFSDFRERGLGLIASMWGGGSACPMDNAEFGAEKNNLFWGI
jgi:hypothetical protein